MDKIKKALEKAEEKTKSVVSGGGGGGGGEGARVHVPSQLSEHLQHRVAQFKSECEGAAILHRRVSEFAKKAKELAVVSSNFSTDCAKLGGAAADGEHLRAVVLPFVGLNALGEKLELLAADVASLEKLDLTPCAHLVDKVNKRAKHVEALKKKNDANALTEENGLKADIESLEASLSTCKTKYEVVLRKVSSSFGENSIATTKTLLDELQRGSAEVEVAAPPAIHRK